MIDGEKRIVTFMGDCGRRVATINYKEKLNLYEVVCQSEENPKSIESKFFRIEGHAQEFAEEFTFGEKYGNV